jgi:hypothetical protein
MLQFCRNKASARITKIVEDIERSRDSEEGLELASLDLLPIGDDLANGEAFVLWHALKREPNCSSLVRLLGSNGLMPNDKKSRTSMERKMKDLTVMAGKYSKDKLSEKKNASMTARLCALLSGGKRGSSSSSVEQPLDEEVLHGTTI